MLDEVLSDGMTVIGLGHKGMGQRWLWRHLGKHGLKHRALMTVPCCQDDRDAGALIATARMAFGGPAAPRAAQSLGGVATVFFNAPAAC